MDDSRIDYLIKNMVESIAELNSNQKFLQDRVMYLEDMVTQLIAKARATDAIVNNKMKEGDIFVGDDVFNLAHSFFESRKNYTQNNTVNVDIPVEQIEEPTKRPEQKKRKQVSPKQCEDSCCNDSIPNELDSISSKLEEAINEFPVSNESKLIAKGLFDLLKSGEVEVDMVTHESVKNFLANRGENPDNNPFKKYPTKGWDPTVKHK